MDIVSELYSKPMMHGEIGRRQMGGGPFDTLRKYAIPIWHQLKEKLSSVGKDVAEAVKDASQTTMRKIAQEIPNVAAEGVKRVIERVTEKFINQAIGATSSRKRSAAIKHKVRPHHKQSRVDKLLGDDSY